MSVARNFITAETAAGFALIAAAALALIVANSALASTYTNWLHLPLGPLSVHHWINDGLMAVFFLLVGLEMKREVVEGQLSTWPARRLPIIAALAGMAVPALVYLAIAGGQPGLSRGWAIPAATDIAFALGMLALLGKRVPASLKLFLTSVAVIDDMGAVAIIAIAYSAKLNIIALAAAAVILAAMLLIKSRSPLPYIIGFAALWIAMFLSGVHATVAGVLAALAVPMEPLRRMEHALHPWVAFLVVPLFGFANAGVALGGAASLLAPLPLAVALGLFLGKQAGIFSAVWLSVRLGFAPRPGRWAQVYGIALLSGIGFTMSLFIGALAFPHDPALVEAAKLGTLGGSLLSALAGLAVLGMSGRGTAFALSRRLNLSQTQLFLLSVSGRETNVFRRGAS